jgi:hypothetical protein
MWWKKEKEKIENLKFLFSIFYALVAYADSLSKVHLLVKPESKPQNKGIQNPNSN